MAVDVIKCPTCGMYYDSNKYAQCPYCSEESGSSNAPKKEKKKSFWKKDKPAPTPKKEEEPNYRNRIEDKQEEGLESSDIGKTVPFWGDFPDINDESESDLSISDEPVVYEDNVITDPIERNPVPSVTQRANQVGKTIGMFISSNNATGEVTYPVVGWLVCTKGEYYGQSFTLRAGKNRIGRSTDMEVSLPKDMSVSSQSVLVIIYDSKANAFSVVSGESSSSLGYVNNEAVYERIKLSGYEKIELGDSEKNSFVFVPFCNDKFKWNQES